MTLSLKDKDRLIAAMQAAALRVIQERQLPVWDASLAYTEDNEGHLLAHFEFSKVLDKEP